MNLLEIPSDERQDVEYLADLYACVVAIEQIEKAQRREYITPEQYNTAVDRLLKKYNNTVSNISSSKNAKFTSSEQFLQEYCGKYHAAINTIKMGPVSVSSDSKRLLARQVMDCTQLFITTLDTLHLKQLSVDSLNPLIADLIRSLKKLNVSDKDSFQSLSRWHDQFNSMNAADALDEEGTRQLKYDLERGYADLRAMIDSENQWAPPMNFIH